MIRVPTVIQDFVVRRSGVCERSEGKNRARGCQSISKRKFQLTFIAQARSIARDIAVLALNATAHAEAAALMPWLERGQTVAFVGSSGVGKSTLVNALLAGDVQTTSGIREQDGKGRHTTTSRQMFALPSGAWVIDTPGMRELKLGSMAAAVSAVFDDIETLARECRFRDCRHHDEPGCAVREGIDPDRLRNYQKLLRESRRDTIGAVERQRLAAVWKARGRATRAWMKAKRGDV